MSLPATTTSSSQQRPPILSLQKMIPVELEITFMAGTDEPDVEVIKYVKCGLSDIPQGAIDLEKDSIAKRISFYNDLGIWDPCGIL